MTEITLRRATHLRRSIEQTIAQLEATLNTTTTVPATFTIESTKNARATAKADFDANLRDLTNLRRVLFNIRKAVDARKAAAGIDDLVSDRTFNTQIENTLVQFLTGVTTYDETRLQGSLDLASRQSTVAQTSRFGQTTGEVSVPLLDRNEIEQHRTALADAKRKIIEIDDKLMELNATNRITVSDTDWQFLSRKNIV